MSELWTEEEKEFLQNNYAKLGPQACADHLGRTKAAIWRKAWKMDIGAGRYFTDKEKKFIDKNIGKIPLKTIAKRTGHSYESIKTYICRHGYANASSTNNRMTISEFARLMNIPHKTVITTYVKHGLNVKKAGKFKTVDIDEAMEWLRTHPERWDATRCEKWFFQRYEWFEAKRKVDFQKMVERRWGA